MYVDHANCSSCGARFQPEAIGSGGRCPSCVTTLGIKDLFGVAAARPSTSEDQGISNIFAALDEIRRGRGG